jgi:hypothetical protein
MNCKRGHSAEQITSAGCDLCAVEDAIAAERARCAGIVKFHLPTGMHAKYAILQEIENPDSKDGAK